MSNGGSLFDRIKTRFTGVLGDVKNFLKSNFSREDLTATDADTIVQAAKEVGHTVSTEYVTTVQDYATQTSEVTAALRTIDDDYFVPQALWDIEHDWNISSNLIYRFEVSGISMKDGKRDSSYFSLGSNNELLLGEAKDNLLAFLSGQESFYGLVVDTIEIEAVLARPNYRGGR